VHTDIDTRRSETSASDLRMWGGLPGFAELPDIQSSRERFNIDDVRHPLRSATSTYDSLLLNTPPTEEGSAKSGATYTHPLEEEDSLINESLAAIPLLTFPVKLKITFKGKGEARLQSYIELEPDNTHP
jgi:hypothetical protein